MLHIIIMILKIIGIILLAVLGLFLLLLSLILFVPVRYRGRGSYYEKLEGTVRLTWLLHFLSLTVSYREGPDVRVRVLGFRIFKPASETSTKEKRRRKRAEKAEEDLILTAQSVEDSVSEPMVDPKTELLEGSDPDPVPPLTNSGEKDEPVLELPEEKTLEQKKGFFKRIAGRIKKFFKRFMRILRNLWQSLKKAENFRQQVMDFICDEQNQRTFTLLKKQAKRLLKHVLPGKLRGQITFGLEDPYVMGQILTGAAFFYPLYHRQFSLQPVFEREILEGELSFRGRIRLGTLLFAGIRILLDKNFRVQLKKLMNRGGM